MDSSHGASRIPAPPRFWWYGATAGKKLHVPGLGEGERGTVKALTCRDVPAPQMIHSIRKFVLSERAGIPALVHFWTSFKPERQERATAVIPGRPAERARTYRSDLAYFSLQYSINSISNVYFSIC